ncbi:hypothetical protein HPB51_004223 [Rhipicephalus microplus]|uniref:MULE transposase domain-containing protein n=1 Tax=Rhipicephalus microplus TaxID=6941 RepID=A0A9J6DYK3_RHIMP|nr:hypothetical protein HPB51_004223 [Rhipicephalus microplus]
MEIEPGARFASYEEFERALRKLQLETNSVYVKKTTKSVDVVNAHLTSGAVKLDEKLEFANVTFTCKHGGNFRTRGTGVWPNQSIIQKLKEETGKVIIAKDVHNMRTNNNRGNDTEKLLQMISDLREKEQATVIPITDESQELRLLYVQTCQMHRMFEEYPEVLFLDATYRTNKHRMPLFVFMVEDGVSSSHVVAYAFVASEQQHVVSKLLETFVKENVKTSETNVVIIDKDFTEIAAIRETFNSKPAVQHCQFHVMKAFRAAAGRSAHYTEEQERLISSFGEMVCAPTPEKFEDAQTDFLRHANAEACAYFQKNWADITNMWARHLCDKQFTADCWPDFFVSYEGGKTGRNVVTENAMSP